MLENVQFGVSDMAQLGDALILIERQSADRSSEATVQRRTELFVLQAHTTIRGLVEALQDQDRRLISQAALLEQARRRLAESQQQADALQERFLAFVEFIGRRETQRQQEIDAQFESLRNALYRMAVLQQERDDVMTGRLEKLEYQTRAAIWHRFTLWLRGWWPYGK